MNQKTAKMLRRVARFSHDVVGDRYLRDLRKFKVVHYPLPPDFVGPPRPGYYLFTRINNPTTERGYYRHLKKVW